MSSGWNKRVRMATGLARVVASARWMVIAAAVGMGLWGCSDGGTPRSNGSSSSSDEGGQSFGGSVRSLFAKAEAAAKEGNVNFFGFYTGMPEEDLVALGAHYDLGGQGEFFYSDNPETHEVYSFRITLKGVRRITNAGNTFDELAQAVADQVGTLKGYDNAYTYKTIDGVTLNISEKDGCSVRDEFRAKEADFAKARVELADERKKCGKTAVPLGQGSQAGERREVTLPGGATMELVWCPPGVFLMGSPKEEKGREDDETQHRVTLTKGFWMAKTEVTQKQWKSVMGNNPTEHKGTNLPVENVSWEDCMAFCRKAGLSLPTEAEWEYACRAGSTGLFAAGGWCEADSGDKSHPVSKKEANDWGLYDMHGNVREWCWDRYGAYPSGAVTNPAGTSSGDNRVFRSGGYRDEALDCRSAYRGSLHPEHNWSGYYGIGFRPVARDEFASAAARRAEDPEQRVEEWRVAAIQGDAKALKALRKAAEQGDAVAQRTLGWIEQEGHEVEQGNENTLVMVTEATFPPFEFLDAGEIVGIDVSICNEIAKELGKTLALRNQPFEAVIPTLMAGNADIAAAGIMVTEERKQNVDFSIPYMTTGIGIIRKAGDETITGGDSLQGKQVGVQSGTTSDVYLVDEMGLEPEEYDSTMSAVTALKAGDLDAVVADIDLVIAITAEDANVEMSPEPLSKEDYAVAVRKGNTELLAVANRVIERIKASGEYDRFREEAEARCNALN